MQISFLCHCMNGDLGSQNCVNDSMFLNACARNCIMPLCDGIHAHVTFPQNGYTAKISTNVHTSARSLYKQPSQRSDDTEAVSV